MGRPMPTISEHLFGGGNGADAAVAAGLADLVAAGGLGAVEGLVGDAEQGIEVLARVFGHGGQPQAEGDIHSGRLESFHFDA